MPNREEQIRARAYELWEQAGRPEGREGEHWEQACREIISDEEGEDPVAMDAAPVGRDSPRTSSANIDKQTPARANAASARRRVKSRGADPEGQSRRPL